MYEIRSRSEVHVQVEMRRVVRRDPTVNEAPAVKVLVPDAAAFGVCGVQDVRDAEPLQFRAVLSDSPANESESHML